MSIEEVIVAADAIRLDRYLKRLFPLLTQGVIEAHLRKGKIRINNEKVKSCVRVKTGDTIQILIGNLSNYQNQSGVVKNFSDSVIALANKLLADYLLYSSEEFIAIDKPPHIAVQGGSKISISIDDALLYLSQISGKDYKLVHRLDKETSGVLLIAIGYENAAKLAKAFRDKLIEKRYFAVLSGVPAKTQDIISNKLIKTRDIITSRIDDAKTHIVESVKANDDGKYAETFYKVLAHNNDVSLVEFRPLTGRMHQLRVHSQLLNCPIIGDIKYGGKENNRMLLHAKEVVVENSVFGRRIEIISALPADFNSKICLEAHRAHIH